MARKSKQPADPGSGPPPDPPVNPPAATGPPPEPAAIQFGNDLRDVFARVTAPHCLTVPEKRLQCGLPAGEDDPGAYIIELNVQHAGSLPGAANDLEKRLGEVVGRAPIRISKSYYRCDLSVREWSRLLARDGAEAPDQRSIYKLWPDFPIRSQIDQSITTIKADAAHRAFDAGGDGIVWAVIDSGIDASHPHFGPPTAPGAPDVGNPDHLLTNAAVRDLHRYFADQPREENGVPLPPEPLPSPDADPTMGVAARKALIDRHRALALTDDLGHGTHVAGIIAGGAPAGAEPRLLELDSQPDPEGQGVAHGYKARPLAPRPDATGGAPRYVLTGIAPRCKLVSLRVLNSNDQGRVSSVIMALDYIREHLNNNPRMMRVHGVNLSVGYDFDAKMFACGQSPLCVEVDRLVLSGVIVVVAAGNTGYGTVAARVGGARVGLSNTINDPGNAELAITVGATHRDSPHTYGVSFFSSKGPTGDGRLKPDLVAPGERITSCATGSRLTGALTSLPAADRPAPGQACYIDDSGTSMAAPHVSGAAAAFLSIRREYIGKPLEVKRIFLASATPLGRDRYFEGNGLVDLMRAIQSV